MSPSLSTSSSPQAATSSSTLQSEDDIPLEELKVVRWARKVCTHVENKNAKAWLLRTASNKDTGINAKVRTSPEYLQELKAAHPLDFQNCPHAAVTRAPGFVRGQPLTTISLTIRTCVGTERPATLFRAIHDGMPHGGIGARGLELTTTNGLFFQRYVQNHFTWNCRQPSPFLSTSCERKRAVKFAIAFDAKGHTGIKVLEIKTTGKYWDHHISRLWDVKHLLAACHLKDKDYHKHEYLVENVIPKEHITRVYNWDDGHDQQILDPRGRLEIEYYVQQAKDEEKFEGLAEYAANAAKRKRDDELEGGAEAKEYVGRTNKFQAVISHARKRRAVIAE